MPPRRETIEVTLAPPARGDDLRLAAEFGIALAPRRDAAAWQLVVEAGALALCAPLGEPPMTLALRTSAGALSTRLRTCRRTDPLPRAIGLPRRQVMPVVCDATAGLFRDAMVLAQLGCSVTGIERLPALAMLACAAVAEAGLAGRLRVVCADAAAHLLGLPAAERPEVVYLDPMFAEAGHAQVKKEMQICRALCGPPEPEDTAALFQAARQAARDRVVVKRHRDLPPLGGAPSFTVDGERVRFDVYLTPA